MRLAHGWRVSCEKGVPVWLVRNYIRPAVRAVPAGLARRLGRCEIRIVKRGREARVSSSWRLDDSGVWIEVPVAGTVAHDVALEGLLCLGEAFWERAEDSEIEAYTALLAQEFGACVTGEIDEAAFRAKRLLFTGAAPEPDRERMEQYIRTSLASTLAEYVHCLWHDVTVRSGSRHLPELYLRRRLELMAAWFPPNRGYRLFPRPTSRGGSPATSTL